MRSRLKEWDNRVKGRPYQTWTRRVIWYQGITDIRLEFTTTDGVQNRIYFDKDEAQKAFDTFKQTGGERWTEI